jgi:hypothetical protein
MALKAAARARMTRPQVVAWHLRRMARKVDPDKGHLARLAEHIEVHPTTLSDWMSQGYIPMFQCKKLHRRFGKLAPIDDLCPPENRS